MNLKLDRIERHIHSKKLAMRSAAVATPPRTTMLTPPLLPVSQEEGSELMASSENMEMSLTTLITPNISVTPTPATTSTQLTPPATPWVSTTSGGTPTKKKREKRKETIITWVKNRMKDEFTKDEMSNGGFTTEERNFKGKTIKTKGLSPRRLNRILNESRRQYPHEFATMNFASVVNEKCRKCRLYANS